MEHAEQFADLKMAIVRKGGKIIAAFAPTYIGRTPRELVDDAREIAKSRRGRVELTFRGA